MSIQTVADATEKPASIFESNLPLEVKLERARTELLALSARNRLLNIPRSARTKILEVVDEQSREVVRLLVREQRTLTCRSGRNVPAGKKRARVGGAGERR